MNWKVFYNIQIEPHSHQYDCIIFIVVLQEREKWGEQVPQFKWNCICPTLLIQFFVLFCFGVRTAHKFKVVITKWLRSLANKDIAVFLNIKPALLSFMCVSRFSLHFFHLTLPQETDLHSLNWLALLPSAVLLDLAKGEHH